MLKSSPFKALTGQKPTLKYIRVSCSAAFVYNENPKSKVHARSIPGVYLENDDNCVYMVETLDEHNLLRSAHSTFDESIFPELDVSDSSSNGEIANEFTTNSAASGTDTDSDSFPY